MMQAQPELKNYLPMIGKEFQHRDGRIHIYCGMTDTHNRNKYQIFHEVNNSSYTYVGKNHSTVKLYFLDWPFADGFGGKVSGTVRPSVTTEGIPINGGVYRDIKNRLLVYCGISHDFRHIFHPVNVEEKVILLSDNKMITDCLIGWPISSGYGYGGIK